MELRTLRYFLAVAQEKNITRAAENLHVTQPTLSRQIGDLEEELGTTLFIRGKRSLELTEDGVLLRQRAQDIVELADRTEHEFAGKRDSVAGTVTIGATEALGGHDLAKAIRRFSQQYPAVRFELYNGMADLLKERIDKGALDLGLLLEPVDTTRYEFIRLAVRERWGVLVHRSHPFAGRAQVAVRELVGQPLMLPSRPSARREILNWIGCEENRLNILVGYNLLSNIALLVEQGMGGGRLYGRGALAARQPRSAVCAAGAGTHHPQRAGLEEKPGVQHRDLAVYPKFAGAAGRRRTSGSLRSGRNLKANTIIHVQAPG